jgi:acylphosphatase
VLVARRYVVKGRVQRVGYRFFVENAAQREGIRGYVRNQHDGSVEIVAEGDLDALVRFERDVRRGPSGARVDDVETIELEASGRFAGFNVTG